MRRPRVTFWPGGRLGISPPFRSGALPATFLEKTLKGRQCIKIKANKERCRAIARTGTEFCFSHDPSSKKAHLEASAKGGSVTQWRGHELIAVSDLEEIQTPKDVLRVLNQTLADLRSGKLPPNVAGPITYMVQAIMSALRLGYETRESYSGPLIVIDHRYCSRCKKEIEEEGEKEMTPERKRIIKTLERTSGPWPIPPRRGQARQGRPNLQNH